MTKPKHVYLYANRTLGEAAENGSMVLLGWTTTPPTEPGWYWAVPQHKVYREYCEGGVTLVFVFEDPEIAVLLAQDVKFDSAAPLIDFTHWLGPLPVPQPPEVE